MSAEEPAVGRRLFGVADRWKLKRSDGFGPFISRLRWELPDGGEATWDSRRARRRGEISVRTREGEVRRTMAPAALARRLRRVNWVAAAAFTIGGSLFVIGAAVAQLGSGDATTAASIYFAG